MLSEFGIALRKVRLERHLLLKDMADALGVSSAFLSSVESGKRKIPKDWIEKISSIYNLHPDEHEALERASAMSMSEIRIHTQNASIKQKDLAFSFAKALDSLSDEDVERIMNAINAGKRGDKHRKTRAPH